MNCRCCNKKKRELFLKITLENYTIYKFYFMRLDMMAVNVVLIAVAAFMLTITFIVVAQEISVWLGLGMFVASCYGAYKIIGSRLTKL